MRRRSTRVRADDAATRFLNVDLDVFAGVSLEPLAAALGDSVIVLHVGKHGRTYRAHFELRRQFTSPDRTIAELVALVRRLPRPAQALWRQARRRDFNVGIQSGRRPYGYEIGMTPATLKLISGVNARLVITVYAAPEYGDDS